MSAYPTFNEKEIFELNNIFNVLTTQDPEESGKKFIIDYFVKQILLQLQENLKQFNPKTNINFFSKNVYFDIKLNIDQVINEANEVIKIIDSLIKKENLEKMPFPDIKICIDRKFVNVDHLYLYCAKNFLNGLYCLLQGDSINQNKGFKLIDEASLCVYYISPSDKTIRFIKDDNNIVENSTGINFEFAPAVALLGLCYEQGFGIKRNFLAAYVYFFRAGLLLNESNALHRLCIWVKSNPNNWSIIQQALRITNVCDETNPKTYLELCELAAGVPSRAQIPLYPARYHRDAVIKPSNRAICELAVIYLGGLQEQTPDLTKVTTFLNQVKAFRDSKYDDHEDCRNLTAPLSNLHNKSLETSKILAIKWTSGVMLQHLDLLGKQDPMHIEYCLGLLAEALTQKLVSSSKYPSDATGMLIAYNHFKAAALSPLPPPAILQKETETHQIATMELVRETAHLPTPLLKLIYGYMGETQEERLQQKKKDTSPEPETNVLFSIKKPPSLK